MNTGSLAMLKDDRLEIISMRFQMRPIVREVYEVLCLPHLEV